ncbi:MAG: ABC transporter permease [Gemmatimonadota bacterium]|nr:ABC transporter permease [Gemmatimonadota bacterium]
MSRRALHLFGLAAILGMVLVLRREAFLEQWSNPALDARVATRFVVIAPVLCMLLGLRDVLALWRPARETTQKGGSRAEGHEGPPRPAGHGRGPYRVAMRRFAENRLAMAGLYAIAGLCLVAILAPLLAPFDPTAIDDPVATRHLPPSAEHPFGTDEYGRDWLSRALYGARVSLSVAILAVMVAVTVGTIYGAVAGYFGGFVDNALMRIVDVIMAFPTFFLMLMLVGVFEASLLALVLIMGLTSWTGTARFIRGEILSLKERDFIEAARAMGLPHRIIIFRHLIPNALAPVLVSAALMVGGMIGAEAGLSFLGIGIRPPTPSWGNMVSQGQDAIFVAWWVALFPGLLLSITILSFNLLADGLRDALDPKTLMRKYV